MRPLPTANRQSRRQPRPAAPHRGPTTDRDSRLLERLRALHPSRTLDRAEAEQIAERQALLLRRELGVSQFPSLPVDLVASVPFVRIAREHDLPTPGALVGTRQGWVIALKASDAAVRQRFSFLHEFKHLLDDPFTSDSSASFAHHDSDVESVCNHFAACALMPRPLLKRDWGNGLQRLDLLAQRYAVSRAAMEIRLREIGLIAPLRHGANPGLDQRSAAALARRLAQAWSDAPTPLAAPSLDLTAAA